MKKQLEKPVNQGRGMTMKVVVQIKLTEAEVQENKIQKRQQGRYFQGSKEHKSRLWKAVGGKEKKAKLWFSVI